MSRNRNTADRRQMSLYRRVVERVPRWLFRGRKVILVNGMRRSGNHACVYWLMNAIAGERTVGRLKREGRLLKSRDGRLVFLNNTNFVHWIEYAITLWKGRRAIRRATWIVVSLEECGAVEIRREQWRAGTPTHRILIKRSVLNLAASRIAYLRNCLNEGVGAQRMPCNKEFFEKLHSFDRLERDGWLPWEYEAWLTSPAYRRRFLDNLGLVDAADIVPETASQAGGSSFGGISEPKVDELARRFEMIDWLPAVVGYALEPEFRHLLNRNEISFLESLRSTPETDTAPQGERVSDPDERPIAK